MLGGCSPLDKWLLFLNIYLFSLTTLKISRRAHGIHLLFFQELKRFMPKALCKKSDGLMQEDIVTQVYLRVMSMD